MEAEAIMAAIHAGNPPSDWNVWPLRRKQVTVAAIKWGLMAVVGFAVLIPILINTVPADFDHADGFKQSVATTLILLVGALAFSSLWLTIDALLHLRSAEKYWLVITPEHFVKADPRRLYSIPLEDIGDITLKGVALPSDTEVEGAIGPQQFAMGQFSRVANQMGVRQVAVRRSRASPSLAFRDRRDNRVITVGVDDSFDHLGAIEHILRERTAQREEALWRASLKR
jgi:hypothetical protein